MADKSTSSPVVMTASGTNSPGTQATTPKKTAALKSKKPRSKPTHPRTSEMVNAAIKALKERAGSSLQAIKKYIASTYKVDAEKHAPFIRKYLKSAVASGVLVQTKGKGAAGSFRLATAKLDASKAKAQQQSGSKAAPPKRPAAMVAAPKKSAPPKKTPVKRAPPKKVPAVAVSEKRKTAKGPAAKPPKAKTTTPKSKTVAKAPTKKGQTKKTTVAAAAAGVATSATKKKTVSKKASSSKKK